VQSVDFVPFSATMRRMRHKFLSAVLLLTAIVGTVPYLTAAQATTVEKREVTVHVFQRDDCTYCKAEKKFLRELADASTGLNFKVVLYDIVSDEIANDLYQQITTKKEIPRITPITIIGNTLLQGFDAPETTGERIISAIKRAENLEEVTLKEFIATDTTLEGDSDSGCDSEDVCGIDGGGESEFIFKLPFFGVIDLQVFSLVSLSVVLGTVDGFNPCAMWVLITFLLILLQIGSKKRMWQIAGLFIVAEAAMYWLILNVWYTTWDFVGLDGIVTPLIGFLAVGGGTYFLYKWNKSRKVLTCDVAGLETQGKIQTKIHKIANAPLTFAAIGGIVAIAFSVNIIEFACSVGIPQAFTKILELNQLGLFETQGYTFLYILFYMLDDFIVFGLALWGFNKIHAMEKYSRLSMLIGGVLMIILGVLLAFAPNLLTF